MKTILTKEKEFNYTCPKCKSLFVLYNYNEYICHSCNIELSIQYNRPHRLTIGTDDCTYNIFNDKSISFISKKQLQYNAMYDYIEELKYDSSLVDKFDEYDYNILYKILAKYIENEVFK